MPRATKLRRIVQKACRYTLIAKTPFRLSVPKVRFLLATLTYTIPEWLHRCEEGKGRESMSTQRRFAEAMYIKIIGSDY